MTRAGARRSASSARSPSFSRLQRLAVAATAPFGADVLERLAARHDIAYVLTRPDRPRGRGRKAGPPAAKAWPSGAASRCGSRSGWPASNRTQTRLWSLPTVLSFRTELLDRALWLNVHPSLLPRWRGAAPVERAIMAGDRETGVTIHRTTAELDAGPIAAQRAFPIEPDDDAGAVYAKAAPLASELLEEVLAAPRFAPQPEDGSTYADKISADDRLVDWSRPPEEIIDRVRALSPHIGARTELDGRPVLLWRARVEEGRAVPVEVQPEGRRRMSYEDFLRGVR